MTPSDAWCERFGTARDGYFFTVRNPGDARDLTLTLDLKALGIEKPAFTAVTGCRVRNARTDRVRLAVPAQWTAVVAVNRTDAAGLASAHRQELARFRPSQG